MNGIIYHKCVAIEYVYLAEITIIYYLFFVRRIHIVLQVHFFKFLFFFFFPVKDYCSYQFSELFEVHQTGSGKKLRYE